MHACVSEACAMGLESPPEVAPQCMLVVFGVLGSVRCFGFSFGFGGLGGFPGRGCGCFHAPPYVLRAQ